VEGDNVEGQGAFFAIFYEQRTFAFGVALGIGMARTSCTNYSTLEPGVHLQTDPSCLSVGEGFINC
jgi:hypothetical protein